MKTTVKQVILISVISLWIVDSSSVYAQATKKTTTITEMSGYVKEEIPTAVLPIELIDKVAQKYSTPTFGHAYQLVRSDEVVGFEVEFMVGDKSEILQYKLQSDEKELRLLGKDGE